MDSVIPKSPGKICKDIRGHRPFCVHKLGRESPHFSKLILTRPRGAVCAAGRTSGATSEKFRGFWKQTSKKLPQNVFRLVIFHIKATSEKLGGNF